MAENWYGYNDYNHAAVMGRLTRDPEIRYTQGDNPFPIARFSLAVGKRTHVETETADFINCVAFRSSAQFVEKYLHKGSRVLCSGRLVSGSYTNKDGQTVYTLELNVEDIQFGEGKASPNNTSAPAHQQPKTGSNDGFMNIPDGIEEELPFN